MKVLSIKQPWASLIVCGAKRFEIRSWKTDYRGPLVIHASSAAVSGPFYEQLLEDGLESILERAGLGSKAAMQQLPRSAIVGQVTLANILTADQLRETATADDACFTALPDEEQFYWRLESPYTIEPITGINGKLNLWSPSAGTTQMITQSLKSAKRGSYSPTKSGKAPADWSEYEPLPVMPSPALAKIIGDGPIKRDEIVKRLWAYIVKHGLRDPKNDQLILPNGPLAKVLGGAPIGLFEIVERLAPHLTTTEE